jgi:hypothetical protein
MEFKIFEDFWKKVLYFAAKMSLIGFFQDKIVF